MPKRSIEDEIKKLNSKIKKLENKKANRNQNVHKRKRLRFISTSSESSEEINQDTIRHREVVRNHIEDIPMRPEASEAAVIADILINDPLIMSDPSIETEITTGVDPNANPDEPTTSNNVSPSSEDVGLDPELLLALGESTSDTPEYGKPIHESLAKLWLPVLKKGLSKDLKENLMNQNLIPDICKLLQSPKLNPEIAAAVSEIVRGRDKKLIAFQQQLGVGITAVNRGMDILLTSDDKAQALKYSSDACKILTDHYAVTKDRIKLVTPSLEKNFLQIIQDTERDDTLFGNELSEKIRTSKAITRQGLQIKKEYPRGPATFQSAATRSIPQGNWRGPPRYQSSRGGRGAYKKTFPAQRPYTAATAPAKLASQAQYKSRAPTRQ